MKKKMEDVRMARKSAAKKVPKAADVTAEMAEGNMDTGGTAEAGRTGKRNSVDVDCGQAVGSLAAVSSVDGQRPRRAINPSTLRGEVVSLTAKKKLEEDAAKSTASKRR
jgi:hypothetical protein